MLLPTTPIFIAKVLRLVAYVFKTTVKVKVIAYTALIHSY